MRRRHKILLKGWRQTKKGQSGNLFILICRVRLENIKCKWNGFLLVSQIGKYPLPVYFFPRGVLPNKEVGGLGPHITFGGKIWGKVRPSSPTKRKNLGSSVTTRLKSWEKVPILGSYLKFREQNLAYLSFIFLEAKFGAPTRISEAKFRAKPTDLLIWKYPPGLFSL